MRQTTSKRGGGLPSQTGHVAVKVVLVPGRGSRISILPKSMVIPSGRQSADAASPASDPQWVRAKPGVVTGASLPPIGGGVDHWVATNTSVVGVREIADPANH